MFTGVYCVKFLLKNENNRIRLKFFLNYFVLFYFKLSDIPGMDEYKIFETDSDALFDFISSQVHTYIKFKPDKWIKMMSNEEYKVRVLIFFFFFFCFEWYLPATIQLFSCFSSISILRIWLRSFYVIRKIFFFFSLCQLMDFWFLHSN